MKKIIIGLLLFVGFLGCSGIYTFPKNFAERATSELKIDIRLSSKANYFTKVVGYSDLKSAVYVEVGAYVPPSPSILGGLICTDDRILFIKPLPEKYETIIDIQHKDIVDVLVPAWGASRRLLVKCKSNSYTFELSKDGKIDREGTYNFYRFIATKAGLEIKPGSVNQTKSQTQPIPPKTVDTIQKPRTPTLVTPSSGTATIVTVSWTFANIRSGPGNDYSQVASAKQGEKLTVIGELGEWFNVRLENGQQGWVTNRAVK
jgi:hypothetical protein